MRNVSTSLKNAIEAAERVVRHSVTVDWDNDGVTDVSGIDDMSHKIGRVAVDQSLESSLPAQVRIVPGAAVAQLDMTLERGNAFRFDAAAAYRSITTASSGSTPSSAVTVTRPAGVLPGELVIVAIITINSTNSQTILLNANVPWSSIGIRGDGTDFTNRVEGQCYVRRVAADEPPSYTFSLASVESWVAAAIRIGDPGLMGVHAAVSKGQDDETTTYPIVSGPPITTILPNCTVVGIFGANAPVTGATWSPLDGDTERADVTTTNSGDQATMAVMTADNVAPGTYLKRATLNIGANVTSSVQFTVALAPRLSGSEAQHAAWTFSELNPASPYAGKDRFGRRTQWKVGFHGDTGLEQVQVFTGLSIAGSGSSRSRVAAITALDNRETLRDIYYTSVPLIAERPTLLDGFHTPGLPCYPGLETTWIISNQLAFAFISRSNLGIYTPEKQGPYGGYGYFAGPPIRAGGSNCLWAPMHGSMEAFSGEVWWAFSQIRTSTRRRVKFAVGPFVAGTEPAPLNGYTDAGYAATASQASVLTGTKQLQGRIELWARFNGASGTLSIAAVDDPGTTTQKFEFLLTGGGNAVLNITMPGGITRSVNGPTVPTDSAWHFYGVHVDSPTGSAVFRLDGVSTSVTFATWVNATTPNNQLWVTYHGTDGAQSAELQVSGGYTDVTSLQPASILVTPITPWINENFVPSAYIDKSENELDTFPFVDPATDTWGLLSAIADTEFAAIYFDGQGIPHYRNTRSDVNAVGQTVQKLLTTRVNVKDLEYSSEVSQVANVINVGYTQHAAFVEQIAWSASGALKIPRLSTITFTVQMPGVVFEVLGFNAFTGNTAPDGSGTVIPSGQFSITASGAGLYGIYVTIQNLSLTDAYLVDTTGQPTPQLTASWMGPSNATVGPVQNRDIDSIRRYREQPLSVPATVWRQSDNVAAMWAQFLVSELGTPSPVIRNVPVVGDPRIELGDLDTLQDPNGLGVSGQFRVTAIRHEGSVNGGYSQTLTVRRASNVAYWNINNWDDGTVWGI